MKSRPLSKETCLSSSQVELFEQLAHAAFGSYLEVFPLFKELSAAGGSAFADPTGSCVVRGANGRRFLPMLSALVRERVAIPGEVIWEKQEEGDSMAIVMRGQIRCSRMEVVKAEGAAPLPVDLTFNRGHWFGEEFHTPGVCR